MLYEESNNIFFRDASSAVSLMGLRIVEEDDRARDALEEDLELCVAWGGANEIADEQLIPHLVAGVEEAQKYVDMGALVYGELTKDDLSSFEGLKALAGVV